MKRVSSASLRCFERERGDNGGENVKREQTVCIRFIYLYRIESPVCCLLITKLKLHFYICLFYKNKNDNWN